MELPGEGMKKVFILSFICIIILYFFMTEFLRCLSLLRVPYFVEVYVIRTVVPEKPFRNVFMLTSIIIVF